MSILDVPLSRSLRAIASTMNASLALEGALDALLEAVCHHTEWSMAAVMSVDEDTGFAEVIARHRSARMARALQARWTLATSPARLVLTHNAPVFIRDAQAAHEFPGYRQEAIERGYRSVMVLPLDCQDIAGRPMVISVQSHEAIEPARESLAFLETLAHLGALAVDKAHRLATARTREQRLQEALALRTTLMRQVLAEDSLAAAAAAVAEALPWPMLVVDLEGGDVIAGRTPDAARIADAAWREAACTTARRDVIRFAQMADADGPRRIRALRLQLRGQMLHLPALVEPVGVDGEIAGALILFPPDGLSLPEGGLSDLLSPETRHPETRPAETWPARTGGSETRRTETRPPEPVASEARLADTDFADAAPAMLAAAPTVHLDLDALQSATLALGVQMLRGHERFRSQAQSIGELFAEIVAGGWRDREGLGARARRLGIDIGAPARLIALGLPQGPEGDDRTIADLQRAVARIAAQHSPSSVVARLGGTILCHLPFHEGQRDPRESAFLRKVLDEAEWRLGGRVVATVGRACAGLEDYPAAWQECERLFELSRRFGREGLISAQDFGPLSLLLSAADSAEVLSFVEGTIGPIRHHDAAHGTDYVDTLAAFLDHGCRPQACADAMGLHVTTLRYRLTRIQELFGTAYGTPGERFGLELAIRLAATLES